MQQNPASEGLAYKGLAGSWRTGSSFAVLLAGMSDSPVEFGSNHPSQWSCVS
jgi:hypothetical protein